MAKKISEGHSSHILTELFGDVSLYSHIMAEEKRKLIAKYKDKSLEKEFNELPDRIITMLPMAFYDAMMKDMGKRSDRDVLAAIGLNCLLIGTHDDVVDEMPNDRTKLAALVYAGNIAAAEGMLILAKKGKFNVAKALVESINKNHVRQQKVVDILWKHVIKGKKLTRARYLEGIKHIIEFISIGMLCATADANRNDMNNRVMKFSEGYGPLLQIIDDVREVDEDKEVGYSSLALTEGKPYSQSLKIGFDGIAKARESLKPEWRRMNMFVDKADRFLCQLKDDIDE